MRDGNLLDIFAIPFLRGDPHDALGDANSLAISESEARRRFGTIDVLGKTLTLALNTGNVDYRIRGVFKDIPKNSNLSANIIARFDLNTQFADRRQQVTSWGNQ